MKNKFKIYLKTIKNSVFLTETAGLSFFQLLFTGCSYLPVVAVDVVQPAALLDDLHGPRHVLPRGEAVPSLVLLAIAGLDAAAVGALLLPAGVVVGALLRL